MNEPRGYSRPRHLRSHITHLNTARNSQTKKPSATFTPPLPSLPRAASPARSARLGAPSFLTRAKGSLSAISAVLGKAYLLVVVVARLES